jgi:hypothetical protein
MFLKKNKKRSETYFFVLFYSFFCGWILLEDVVCARHPDELLGRLAVGEGAPLPDADPILDDAREEAQLCNVLLFGGRRRELLDGYDDLQGGGAALLVGVLPLLDLAGVLEEVHEILMLCGRDRRLGLRVSHFGLRGLKRLEEA